MSSGVQRELGLVAGFTLLTVACTWPVGNLLAAQVPHVDDSLFSIWRLAWVAHQLPRDPLHLFDANIFWPEPNTLAFSDAMLLLGMLAAPLIWCGVHPLVAHNLLLLASFVTSGLAAASLLRLFTPSLLARATGGIIFAFAPYRFAHIGHLELLWTAFLPLSLLTLYRVLERPAPRRAVTFGAMVGLQGLCSIYYLVFGSLWLALAALLAPLHRPVRWHRRHVLAGALALVTVGALLSPYLRPYMDVREALGGREESEIARYSAQPADYLRTASQNRLYGGPYRAGEEERSQFVGVVPLALAAMAIVWLRTRTVWVMLALTLVAVDLSLGVHGLLYDPLRSLLPPLGGLRAPARFGVFALLGIAVLASLTVARLQGTRRRGGALLTLALVGALLLEFWSAPLEMRALTFRAPRVDEWLAAQQRVLVLQLPVPPPHALWGHETLYQYRSIYHWQPTLNGYSGYVPQSYVRMLDVMRDFPSEAALRWLHRGGVRVLVLHDRLLPAGHFDRLLLACGDRRWFQEVQVFAEGGAGRTAGCRFTEDAP